MNSESLNPLLKRIDQVEHRIHSVESSAGSAARSGHESEFARKLAGHAGHIEDLREDMKAMSFQTSEQIATLEDKLVLMESRVGQEVERCVDARFAALARNLERELASTFERLSETFVQALEAKVVSRINALEENLGSQAGSVEDWREQTRATDLSLQRLVESVERLCAQPAGTGNVATEAAPTATESAVPVRTPEEATFAEHLTTEIARKSEASPDHPNGFKLFSRFLK